MDVCRSFVENKKVIIGHGLASELLFVERETAILDHQKI